MTQITVDKNCDSGYTDFSKESGGIHIIGDFFNCLSGKEHMLSAEKLEVFCSEMVRQSGLTEVGKAFVQFPQAGVTGTVLLAESHVAIHTWPEKDYLTLDVFVCNVTQDNTDRARALFESFVNLFQPEKIKRQEVYRD